MTLRFTGRTGGSEYFEHMLEAFDGDHRLMVAISQEAVEDYGMDACQAKADQKYKTGDKRVEVRTIDF